MNAELFFLFLNRRDMNRDGFNCLFSCAISWWSAQWTVQKILFIFLTRRLAGEFLAGWILCCTLNWKRIQTWSLSDESCVSFALHSSFCSFCRFETTCWWPARRRVCLSCVFVMILISYRQIYFRLLNSRSKLIDEEQTFFLCQNIFYVNIEPKLFSDETRLKLSQA